MKIKLSVLMVVGRKYTALLLACTMLFNLTSEAAAQYRSFTPKTGGGVPPFDYKAPADNTRVASKNLDAKLMQAKLKSEDPNSILSYEEVKKEVLKINKAVPLSEDVIQAIYQQYLQDVNKQDSEVNKVFQLSKNDFHLDYYLNEAYKQGGRVCIEKQCYEQANFVQGILRASLYQGLDEGSSSKQYKWNREVMLAEIPNIYSALEMGGVHRKDAAKLQKYTKFILEKADDYCDNDTYLVDIMPGLGTSFSGKSNGRKSDAEKGKETRRKQCENVGKALVVLGMAGQTVQERGENAAIIYKVMKDTYKDDYGAITAMNGAAGLIAAGTVSSYNYLDRFLTVDTLKGATDFGTFWNGCKWVLDLLSVQKWIEKGTTVNNRLRGRGGRYLNQLGAVYQYIDEDAARAMGISDYQVGVMKTHPSLGYNIPYRNVLEDLGILVSTTGTKQGNQIAAKILSIYASNVKRSGNAMDEVHTPLVAGVLSTGIIKDANAQYAAQKINNLDWWDLNEATQRRVNNIATKYSGTLSRNKDAAKIKRNENNQKIIQAGFWADMAITAVFMGMLVASIPNMVRSAANFARNVSRIRAINAAGKGNLLKIVRVNIKASGIKPANVKMARQAKQAEAAEVARAERLLKQKGIKKDAYGNPLKQANAADVKTAAAKVKAAKQPKAVKKTPQTEQVQFKVVTKEGQNALVNRNGTLTAVVGEGSGGSGAISGAKTLTAAEKAEIAARTAKDAAEAEAKATAAAEEFARETAYAKANPRPFKGNFLFNKPYNQLSSWRKWAFDAYYFKINPAFQLTGDITKGLAKNPGKTTMMGSLPLGSTAEALVANPIGIYASVGQQANNGFSVVRLAQEANSLGQGASIAKTGSNLLKIKNTVTPLTPIQQAMALGGIVNLPKLVTVLNEPHTGSTGSMRVIGGTSNYYSSLTPAQTAKIEEKTVAPSKENTIKFKEAKPEAVKPEIITPAAATTASKPQMTVKKNDNTALDRAAAKANVFPFLSFAPFTQPVKEVPVAFETYYDAQQKDFNYWSTQDAMESIKEEQSIASAWDRVKKDPLKGNLNSVLVTIKAGSRIFDIQHGAATTDPKTKGIIVHGPALKRARGTHDNFGLTKIIFKHGESREVMPVSAVKKSDLMKLPYILRNYAPVQAESNDRKLVYRVPSQRGNLLIAFSKTEEGRYMLVTMYYDMTNTSRGVGLSPRRDAQKTVAPEKNFYMLQPQFMQANQAVRPSSKQQVPLLAAGYVPEGWKLVNKYDSEKYASLAHTRTEIAVTPQKFDFNVNSNISDPMVLSAFFLMPLMMKIKGRKPLHKQAKDQYLTTPVSAEDLLGNSNESSDNLSFAEDGFFLTYEDAANPGKELLLPVDLDIDNSFKTKGYNRVYLNKNGIAELRNNRKEPKPMSGFFMKLNGYTQDFADFISLAGAAELNGNLKIKLLQVGKRTPKEIVAVKLYTDELAPLPVEVELPAGLIKETDTLVMLDTGEIAVLEAGSKEAEVIEDYYIRLPKNQIGNLVSILKISPRRFGIQIASTKDKAGVVIKEVSMTSVSLGKTFAPVVGPTLGMSEANANSLMFIINYLLPGLSSFFNPILNKFGEKKLLLVSLYLSAAAGIIATASGFYGFVESMPHNPWRTTGFVTAVSLMAVSGILKQLVCNMLIRANRGDVSATKMSSANKVTKKGKGQIAKPVQKVAFADVMKRAKEVFTKKSSLSLQDAFFYNLSFMFKNFGTLLFLALPYPINWAIKMITGIDLGLDYSLSFPIYAAFSMFTLWKTYDSHLRDPYTKKPTAKESIAAAAKEASLTVEEYQKQVLEQNQQKEDIKLMSTSAQTLAADQANDKEHGVMNVLKTKKSVLAVTVAMTLATVHEFVLSSSFASLLKKSFEDGAASNFMVALCLYIPLVVGRLLGNVAGQRMSPSSLYIVGSALSAIGTGIVMMGIGNPYAVMTGAAVASLGVGNFFTQMYNYLTAKYPEHNREISVILSVTMALASLMALPARYLVDWTGIQNVSIMYSMLGLTISLILTSNMMKDSTMYKFVSQLVADHKDQKVNKSAGKTPSAQETKIPGKIIEQEQRPIPPTDINNPLPN